MGAVEGSAWSGWQRDANTARATPESETPEEEIAAIVGRAAKLGIPAWRVSVALGRALPAAEGR